MTPFASEPVPGTIGGRLGRAGALGRITTWLFGGGLRRKKGPIASAVWAKRAAWLMTTAATNVLRTHEYDLYDMMFLPSAGNRNPLAAVSLEPLPHLRRGSDGDAGCTVSFGGIGAQAGRTEPPA